MTTSPTTGVQPVTAAQVEQWLQTTTRKRLALHVHATEPWPSRQHQEAFLAMSALVQEAMEEVRVMSAALREASQGLRARTTEVREHATHLLARPHPIPNAALHYQPTSDEHLYLIEYTDIYLVGGDEATKGEMTKDELTAYLQSRAVTPALIEDVLAKLSQRGAVSLAKAPEPQGWVISAVL